MSTRVKWIDAAKTLAKNPAELVMCPECGETVLTVKDIKNENNPNELERVMTCKSCGANNVLRLKR